jgi:hypothetical protein
MGANREFLGVPVLDMGATKLLSVLETMYRNNPIRYLCGSGAISEHVITVEGRAAATEHPVCITGTSYPADDIGGTRAWQHLKTLYRQSHLEGRQEIETV